jgi:hypothetical protein
MRAWGSQEPASPYRSRALCPRSHTRTQLPTVGRARREGCRFSGGSGAPGPSQAAFRTDILGAGVGVWGPAAFRTFQDCAKNLLAGLSDVDHAADRPPAWVRREPVVA